VVILNKLVICQTLIAFKLYIFLQLQVSYLSADSIFPEWNVWTQFLSETTSGLRLDALDGSHPIEVMHGILL
jgi:aminopeptidase N